MTIDHLGVGVRVLEVARGADHGDSAFAYGDGGVPQDAGVAHLLPFSRSGGTRAGYDLRGVHKQKVLHNLVIQEFSGGQGKRDAIFLIDPQRVLFSCSLIPQWFW
jgi:hypothetical protein